MSRFSIAHPMLGLFVPATVKVNHADGFVVPLFVIIHYRRCSGFIPLFGDEDVASSVTQMFLDLRPFVRPERHSLLSFTHVHVLGHPPIQRFMMTNVRCRLDDPNRVCEELGLPFQVIDGVFLINCQ